MNRRTRLYFYLLSALFHILLLLFFSGAVNLGWLSMTPVTLMSAEEEPIVFDLRGEDMPREVIATPEDARRQRPEDARFLSDKDALARNPESDPSLAVSDPYAVGDIDSHDLTPDPQINAPESEPQQEASPEEEKLDLSDYMIFDPTQSIAKEDRDKAREEQEQRPRVPRRQPGVPHDQRQSRAEDQGGLSFNTYEWDFAPYMLMLKGRIQRNIFPPIAFTRLGAISGTTLLRFRIFPNGQMQRLAILDYQGDKSLADTSYSAVNISAPFPPLPEDFPEPFLEVTGKFIYFIKGRSKENLP